MPTLAPRRSPRTGPTSRRRRSAAAVALALAASACGDTLLDHSADPKVLRPCAPGQNFCSTACVAEDAAHCGDACADCAAGFSMPNAAPICGAARTCSFECSPGWLRSGGECRRGLAVTGGFAHTCALTDDGRVKCWGANERGQLGDGTTTDRAFPVDVGLPGPATAVGAGYTHTCAIVAGAVWCWGANDTGQLGDGTKVQRTRPVAVQGLAATATAVAGGGGDNPGAAQQYYGHTCALAGGAVWCWGGNESGQLGDGTTDMPGVARPPVKSLQTSGATAVAAGERHTCAVVAGAVLCWGANASQQLGGQPTSPGQPVQALGSGATAVATGRAHSCAVVGPAAGGLQCWGQNADGQVNGAAGSPPTQATAIAAPVGSMQPTAVAGGRAHTCALAGGANGMICFGANLLSQLSGAPALTGRVAPPLAAAQAVAAGYDHTCALLSDGGVQCWGANDRGQVGMGQAGGAVPSPTYVSGR